jgi:hypothetical protein
VIASVAFFAWLQFSFGALFDSDSYFHTRAAQQLLEHGVRKEFPQAAFSTWAENYSDKDFLFHVLLVPFCSQESQLIFGGKLGVLFFDFVFLVCFASVIRALKIRFGPLWIVLLLASQPFVCIHLLSVRPHMLGTILLLVETLLLARRKWKSLFAVAAVHVLSHSSFILVLIPLLAYSIVELSARRRMPWKAALSVCCGLAAASLLHPYFPNNLSVARDQIVGVAYSAWGGGTAIPQELFGEELQSMDVRAFLRLLPALVPMAVGFVASVRIRQRPRFSPALKMVALTCLGFGVLTFLSLRFSAVLILLAAVVAGMLWSQVIGARPAVRLPGVGSACHWIGLVAILASVVAGQLNYPLSRYRHFLRDITDERVFQPAVEFLDRHAEPGDIVYHPGWRDFSVLYHYRPQGRYIYALDPIFMYRYDRYLFGEMLSAYRGQAGDLHRTIAVEFGASWIYIPLVPFNAPFWYQVRQTGGFEVVYPNEESGPASAAIVLVHRSPQ